MEPFYYILNGRDVEPCSLHEHLNWRYTKPDLQVGFNKMVGFKQVTVTVSTVFIGINLAFAFNDRPPAIFETRVFGGELNQRTWRYATYEQAEAGHQQILELCQAIILAPPDFIRK